MEDGSGWFADPEVEGQERYFDGSEWTTETRPADPEVPPAHLPDHVPELQRAFAAATADIEDVEARLGRLFDRAQGVEPGTNKARKAIEPQPDPEAEPKPAAEPAVHDAFALSTDADAEADIDAEADSDADAESESAPGPEPVNPQAVGVESLLGTVEDEDDDSLAELDEALATEQPEKLKRGVFRKRS
jgi:hypothetical protein